MAKTTTKTVRFIYDAKGRVKERIEETITYETVDHPVYPTVEPYWQWTPGTIWCNTSTNTSTGATYIGGAN